jgi:hypothetical protein
VEEIERLETTWGVELPEEYRLIAPLYHGMTPEPNVFDIGDGANVLSTLLTLTTGKHEKAYSIATAFEIMQPHVPRGVFSFGMTPGGEYLCFDYRDAPRQPRIVLVTVEMEIYPVANSFREFLEGLHEIRE